MRILVVDDEPGIVSFVDRVLRRAGYRTCTATGGREALQAADASHGADTFDLLLTDVHMPEMSGQELARQVRQRQPEMKVLYLTGFTDQLFAEKPILWEDEAFLDKPTTVDGLLQAVALLLHGTLQPAR
jgi:CheY-like chemotaxis protein